MADLPSTLTKATILVWGRIAPRPYSTPRWVKVFGIILIVVLVLVFLIQHLVFEGMGGHMP